MIETRLDLQELERESHRIVGMICSETVPENEVADAIRRLRERTVQAFPDRPAIFDETYGRRFARLRTRFRPGGGLFQGG